MKLLTKVIIAGWLYAAAWGTTPSTADESSSACKELPCSPSETSGSPNGLSVLTDGAQTPDPDSASRQSSQAPGFFRSWWRMAEHTKAEQPDWLTAIATTSGRLKNEFRYDLWRQTTHSGEIDYTFGGGKGLELIAAARLQIMLGLPPYVVHTPSGPRDGFGDMPLMLKFRLASAARGEGNYLCTLLLSATVPTGSPTVGMHAAVLSPGIALGKGWGRFDVQSTFGANLPARDTAALGRQFLSNTAFQYRAGWKLWPEFEVNSTFFLVGKNRGETQVFLTPGLGFGRARLWGQLGFSAGAGLQIAATGFHTYNHRRILSVRFPF